MSNNNKKRRKDNQPNKKRFVLEEGETIDACLDRIREAGYQPIRRSEKPIFQEKIQGDQNSLEPVAREITFDTVRLNTNVN
ncbi:MULTISPECIES: NETI motif-containing protein [Paraliobacillus]|uniref:NETI motif-containing protein n=1 Tax=Paraliobacillus TaxID=200903 RepID=UPI000DD4759B|nr:MULTISPECIES: NETI motif-containing protein [Paraliobacillus]